ATSAPADPLVETTKYKIMGAHDCCARSQHDTTMRLEDETTLGITPREDAIRAKVSDPFPWVFPILRGRGQYESRKTIEDYKQSLYCEDYVIKRAPDLQNSGCFPGYTWIALCNVTTKQLGLPLLAGSQYPGHTMRSPQRFSNEALPTALRHDNSGRNGLDQFLDRRVNIWQLEHVDTWAVANHHKSFSHIVSEVFTRDDHGPDRNAVHAHVHQADRAGQPWQAQEYYMIAVLRALQLRIDDEEARFQ
ncbi:unnamed protein product, partial [Prorocentrum cordatum]